MKKIYMFIVIINISIVEIMAQATPNAGFENWTHFPGGTPYDDPNNWMTHNWMTAGTFGVVTSEKATNPSDVHSGNYAIKLTNKTIFAQRINIFATTGTINNTTNEVGGGIPYTLRPDSIVGYYKRTHISGQGGYIDFQLLGSGGITDTVGHARFTTPTSTVGSYTRFAKAITYKNATPVVNSIWILSPTADSVPNSTLFVDDLELIFNTTNVSEQQSMELTVGPNPASTNIVVKNPLFTKATISIFDVTGRIILAQPIFNNINSIDITVFPAGLYIYSIVNENNSVIKTDKLIIRK